MKNLTLRVLVNGEEATIKNNGFFSSKLKNRNNVTVFAEVPDNTNILFYTADGKKNLIHMVFVTYDSKKRITRYKKNVGVTDDNGTRECHVHYPTNYFKVLEIHQFGWFTIWEISIVSQYGSFFLRKQRVYNERCFRKYGSTYCPYFEKEGQNHWPELLKILYANIVPNELSPVSNYQAPVAVPVNLKENEGIVIWYNQAMQTGCVMTTHGASRVNYRDIKTAFLYKMLLPAQQVTFEKIGQPKISKRETAFNLQIYGVKLKS